MRTRQRERQKETERKAGRKKREIDLMAVGALSAISVLAPSLLHVSEKAEQTKRKKKR